MGSKEKENGVKQFTHNPEQHPWIHRMSWLRAKFVDLDEITDKWGFFRQLYMEMIPVILERAKVSVVDPVNPYPIDWGSFLSPIEFAAWISIRGHYFAMYPQFPLFNYFIDFANPHLRIGVEMDGKAFHNKEKDAKRDSMLWQYGWRIFRIPGRECFTKYKSYEDTAELEYESNDDRLAELQNWIMNSSDGVLYAIKKVYFQNDESHELYPDFIETLEKHKGCNFNLFDE